MTCFANFLIWNIQLPVKYIAVIKNINRSYIPQPTKLIQMFNSISMWKKPGGVIQQQLDTKCDAPLHNFVVIIST